MNGSEVKQHLENFIAGNECEWFGVATVRRDCKIGYNHAFRTIELGVKQGLFEQNEREPYKYKMARDND